jgi:hypothetical protein
MRMKSEGVSKRSFVFSKEAIDRLERLERTWRLESGSSVLRVALAVFEDLTAAMERGEKVILKTRDGDEISYNPLWSNSPTPLGQPLRQPAVA